MYFSNEYLCFVAGVALNFWYSWRPQTLLCRQFGPNGLLMLLVAVRATALPIEVVLFCEK